jgi:hypothetical protein
VLTRLAVQHLRLIGPDRLPSFYRLAHQWVDRLGERGAGLVRRDVEQADGVLGQHLIGVAGDRHAVVLPPDATQPKPRDLVAALPGEQPNQRDRPNELDWVAGTARRGRQVVGLDVQPRPKQFGPDIVGDDARIRPHQSEDAAWRGQRRGRVEPARHPLPFLKVTKDGPGGGEVTGLGARAQRFAGTFGQAMRALDVVADVHAVDGGDPRRAGPARPLARLDDLRMLVGEPAADLGHHTAENGADLRSQRRSGVPPLDPVRPWRRCALDVGHRPVHRHRRRLAMPERCDRPLDAEQRADVPVRHLRVRPEALERLGGQILQQWAAVQQQCHADGGPEPIVVGTSGAIPPRAEYVADPVDAPVDRLSPEDTPGHGAFVEVADPVEGGETSE